MTVSTTTPHKRAEKNEDFTQRSNLYREFLAERDEILKHKWIESEKQGQDIGFDRALFDWIRKHRSAWRVDRNYLHDTTI
ncbi:MAG TPA: hypothetical protein DD622_01325 [Opitutae bacterium]|nr:hypothetical protein [Coraliomargarita sp.]HBO57058.1 hypothetical protein [Opitutae bacterium]|tara:strand:- start:14 stop:253 length:240 start_codon:yes stop_codon:yes gene_type:complete